MQIKFWPNHIEEKSAIECNFLIFFLGRLNEFIALLSCGIFIYDVSLSFISQCFPLVCKDSKKLGCTLQP